MKKLETKKKLGEAQEGSLQGGYTINNANKYVEFMSNHKCINLINDLIRDCDASAMSLWKTNENFLLDDIGKLIQLKLMRTHLCELDKRLNNNIRWMCLSNEDIESVQKYLNNYNSNVVNQSDEIMEE